MGKPKSDKVSLPKATKKLEGIVSTNKTPEKTFNREWDDVVCESTLLPRRPRIIESHGSIDGMDIFADFKGETNSFAECLGNYRDLYIASDNYAEYLDTALQHVVRHAVTARSIVIRNEKRGDEDARDQGFTRARVVILVPFRSSAYEVVQKLLGILPDRLKKEIANYKRFQTEYGPEGHDIDFDKKSDNFKKTFSGNIDDCFKFGVSFRGTSVKLYSQFYSSDIIIASPLGLRMLVGAPEENSPERDCLSSVECVLLYKAHIFSMQNFLHVNTVAEAMNLIPQESHGTDFSKVREWCLNGWGKFYRQSIILSELGNPDISSFFNRYCVNRRGRVKARHNYTDRVCQVLVPARQVFTRFNVNSVQTLDDERFDFFVKHVFEKYHKSGHNDRTIVFIPSYFDFVRVRNYLKGRKIVYGLCSEYAEIPVVDRSRSLFAAGRIPYLLVTERFMFFREFKLFGAHHVLFYGLPDAPHMYPQILNGLEPGADHTSLAIFSKYDGMALERVIGTDRAGTALASAQTTHMFC